jgi:hypothetical protein
MTRCHSKDASFLCKGLMRAKRWLETVAVMKRKGDKKRGRGMIAGLKHWKKLKKSEYLTVKNVYLYMRNCKITGFIGFWYKFNVLSLSSFMTPMSLLLSHNNQTDHTTINHTTTHSLMKTNKTLYSSII